MKRRRVILIAAGCLVAVVVAVLVWPGEREPEYQGKKLSEWLEPYFKGYSGDEEARVVMAEKEAADRAVRKIGTNSLPYILRSLAYDPPAWRQKAGRLIYRLPRTFYRVLDAADHRAKEALFCFKILGPDAAPAVPELTRMMNGARSAVTRGRAMSALAHIGKDGYPPLLAAANEQKPGAALSILDLHEAGVDVSTAVPALLLYDHKVQTARRAYPEADFFYAVGGLADQPHFLLPVLTNCLRHSNSIVRLEAVRALVSVWKDDPASTTSAFMIALNDTDNSVREAATNTLRQIAPEVLATNAVKER